MIKLFTVAEMVAAEAAAVAAGGSYDELMETAGKAVATAITERLPVADLRVLILVGPGNNGGDGLVAGRYLAQAGADVAFYLSSPRQPESDDNFAQVQQMGLFIIEAANDRQHRVLHTRLASSDILIDALLGTGVSRPIGGALARLMQQIQTGLKQRRTQAKNGRSPLIPLAPQPSNPVAGPFCVAVDCPSGLQCDSGALDPVAIDAHLTVTFAAAKHGHFLFPGAAACGELLIADIGIDPALPEVANVPVNVATADKMQTLLPERPLDGHKGRFGTALIAAGSAQYWGAPLLAAKAAYRTGAGLVAAAVPAQLRPVMAAQLPEATYPVISNPTQLDTAAAQLVQELHSQALLVGPGLGPAVEFMTALLAGPTDLPPLVVDADGLNILATWPNWPQHLPAGSVLTPHPGEMARLMEIPLTELKQQNRIELAQKQATAWGHIVLLKGAYTVVAAPTGKVIVLPFANPLLAVAGSGDVLAGMIAGLLAQGLPGWEAAVLGGYLHGTAATLARAAYGDSGLLAGELADLIPQARQRLQGKSAR